MSEEKKSGLLTKIVAGVFGAIIAPILVALCVKYLVPEKETPPPAPPPPVDSAKASDKAAPPAPWFTWNGKDLTDFYTYLVEGGRDQDPKGVFSVVTEDGAPAIRVSGEVPGYLATQKPYGNYRLSLEYKWGEKTWPPREDKGRASGIIFNAEGADGAIDGMLMCGYECRIAEGATGDLLLHKGGPLPLELTAEVDLKKSKGTGFQFQPRGTSKQLSSPATLWQLNHDPARVDRKGFRSKTESEENPVGQWNSLLLVFRDWEGLSVELNGVRVNGASQLNVRRGKFLFRSYGAEVFFRKIQVVAQTPPKKPGIPTK